MDIYSLLKASFKGQSFLVRNSSIREGQKTVTHVYPNSDRVETEFLGEGENVFSLDMYVTTDEARNNLRRLLKEPKQGVLVHPIDGSITVAVNGQYTIDDNLQEKLGVTIFSVRFVKYYSPNFPQEASNNLQKISSTANSLLAKTGTYIKNGWSIASSPQNYDYGLSTLTGVNTKFTSVVGTVNKQASQINSLYKTISNFGDKKASIVSDSESIGNSVTEMFTATDSVASSNENQQRMLAKFYDYGSEADPKDNLVQTYNIKEAQENDRLMKQAMLTNSLALSYKNASQMDYANQEELDTMAQTLEKQYKVATGETDIDGNLIRTASRKYYLDDEIRRDLITLRNEVNKNFSEKSQVVADVKEISLDENTNITALSYAYYGNLDEADNIIGLNKTKDSAFVKGDTRILTNVENTA